LPAWLAAALLLVPLPGITSAAFADESKASAEHMAETVQSTAADIRVHLALETKLAASDAVSAFEIDTDVKDGVAYLEGTVESEARKELATEIASSVEGVRSVRNSLVVIGGGEPGMLEKMQDATRDVALTTRVKARLLASDNTSGLAISVSSDDGVVTLEGEVDSETEKELAATIAANTAGVADVHNEIVLEKS
jgi:osmotically-inducible protein OsmY